MIRRRPRKWKPEGDVHGAPERSDLDGRHSHIMVRRDHGVKFSTHSPNENCVGGKRPGNSGLPRSGRQELCVFGAESSPVATMRIQRT
jgi:hypothetical protein